VPSILADLYWAGLLLPEIVMILFTQSTAVLHKYLNDELKQLCLLQFFPEIAQNSRSFPCSEKSLRISGFPGLWPPCYNSGWHGGATVGQSESKEVYCNTKTKASRLLQHPAWKPKGLTDTRSTAAA